MSNLKQSKKKTIVFIIGSAHSGSTILDMALGSSPNAFSLGEISQLPKEVEKNTPCVCGEPIRKCPFWLGVNEIMKRRNNIDFMNKPDTLQLEHNNKLTSLQKVRKTLGFSRDDLIGSNSKKLYDAIFEQSQADILIDSRKEFKRAIYLRPNLSSFRIVFIHLIRDVRGVVNSEKKKSYQVQLPGTTEPITLSREPKTLDEILKIWIRGNLKISFFLRTLGLSKRSHLVRYEEFTEKPVEILNKLANWLGLSNIDNMIHFGSVIHHNVHGNPSRFNTKEIIPHIKKWKIRLTAEELRLINKKAGRINQLYGFRD